MNAQNRLLAAEMLPASLWEQGSETMCLPPELSQVYVSMLERRGLSSLAQARDPNNAPVGGATQEKTDQHFAQAFDGSVARAQLAVTDPKGEVVRVSNAFISSLAGNSIVLTDAPCGAGAAAFAFLSAVAELRANDVLPRIPLDVSMLGAELSVPARAYAAAMLEDLRPFLERQGIFVDAEYVHWNVLDQLSNTDLITRMARALQPATKRLLVVANFNGFLEGERRRKEAQPQLEELLRHASGDGAVVIWIEPQMNSARGPGGLFHVITNLARGVWHRFVRVNTDGDKAEPFLETACKFLSPIESRQRPTVRLAVMRLDLGRYS